MKDDFVEMIISGESVYAKSHGMSGRSLLTSLSVSLGLFIFYVAFFVLLRKRFRSIYEPRTFIVAKHFRSPPTSDTLFGWVAPTLRTSNSSILQSSGIDAYFFLRYILFVAFICLAISVPLLVILLPLHLTGRREGVKGMDRLSTLNLSDAQRVRHVAHLMLCVLCTSGSLLFFKAELNRYFQMRARHILSPGDTQSSAASTLLVKGLHPSCRTEESIRNYFEKLSLLPGNQHAPLIKHIWFNKDYAKLHSLVVSRAKILEKLESLEMWLICASIGVGESPEQQSRRNGNKDSAIIGNLWREYMSEQNLSEMLGSRGGLLTWLKTELSRLNSQIFLLQSQDDLFPTVNSCFIQFNTKLSSFIASRSLGSEVSICEPKNMYDRVYPADIIWSNLSTPSWSQSLSYVGATLLNYAFVFGWAAPVAAVSMMSQADVMAQWIPQVHLMVQSTKIAQLFSSVLSPLVVSGLTSQVPTIFRFLAQLKGYPTYTRVEMDVQKYLFLFMFFQLFLIVTLTTGLPGLVVKTLLNTSEGAITLANSLPRATTFFICYLMASCLTTAGNALMQTQQLFIRGWFYKFSKTPRQKMRNECRYSTIYWGSLFPLVTNAGTIAIAYALISPVILLSAVAGLFCLYVAFKYRLIYCYVPRYVADGDYYPKAIFQLFAGLYCQQVSLLGTLLVSSQLNLALLASFVIIGTMISQHYLQRMFQDMSARIPLSNVQVSSERRGFNGSISNAPGESFNETKQNSEMASSPECVVPLDEGILASPTPVPLAPTSPIAISPSASVRTLTNTIRLQTLHSPPSGGSTSSMETLHSPDIRGTATLALHETWMGLFDAVTSDFNDLTPNQKEYVSLHLFEHPDRRLQRPCVWLPRDWKGVAQDQALEMQSVFSDLRSSCNGAEVDGSGRITITQAPPDFDPVEIMKM